MMRRPLLILLLLTLLVGQLGLISHQLDHDEHDSAAGCEVCLVATPLGGVPLEDGWNAPVASDEQVEFLAPPASDGGIRPPTHGARAPPQLPV